MLPDLRCNPLTPRDFVTATRPVSYPYPGRRTGVLTPETMPPIVRLHYVEGILLSVRQDLSQVRYSAACCQRLACRFASGGWRLCLGRWRRQ